jgi:hypothetical protein
VTAFLEKKEKMGVPVQEGRSGVGTLCPTFQKINDAMPSPIRKGAALHKMKKKRLIL